LKVKSDNNAMAASFLICQHCNVGEFFGTILQIRDIFYYKQKEAGVLVRRKQTSKILSPD
jgi:hypothetical protein